MPVAIILAILAISTLHKVDEGYVGVYWRGGALIDEITHPGRSSTLQAQLRMLFGLGSRVPHEVAVCHILCPSSSQRSGSFEKKFMSDLVCCKKLK